jgi:hypothetical protein
VVWVASGGEVQIEDVAGGLSKVCRFCAQAREYYSVAQHAMPVRRLVVEAGHSELALVALNHDSHDTTERVGGRDRRSVRPPRGHRG